MGDFSDVDEVFGFAGDLVEDSSSFFDIGDGGVLVIEGVGFGEGGFGEGGFGGGETRTINVSTTWTDIETP